MRFVFIFEGCSQVENTSLSNDPGDFCNIQNLPPYMVNYLLEKGPMQPTDKSKFPFPKDKYARCFQPSWYWKSLPGNSHIRRDWLSYSVSKDKLYCHHCILFGRNANKTWIKDGFSTWTRAIMAIQLHECSSPHIESSLKFKLRQSALPILPLLEEKRKQENATNREVVRILIDISLFLAHGSLAFRGHRENWNEASNKGNFLNLVNMLTKYSPCLAAYIAKIRGSVKRPEFSFITPLRQNQLIEILALQIKAVIKNQIQQARFFSVSVDSTFDLSRREQLSFVVRYINVDGKICERLLAVKESPIMTGIQMFNIFEMVCNEMFLDWKNFLVGQSYDGAQNMRGQFQGLQAIVKDKCPTATFIWCCAHRMNLVVTKAVSCSLDAVDLFGNLEMVYNFICGSKKRVSFYEECQKKYSENKQCRRLKRVNTTRWMSHDNALDAILDTFESVIDTLEYVRNIESSNDSSAIHMAGCLIDYLLSKRFVLTAFCFKNVFEILSPVNILLQSSDLDLLAAIESITDAQLSISKIRQNKDTFTCLIKQVNSFIDDKGELEFDELKIRRTRRKKRMMDEECEDETMVNPLDKFKVDTYFVCMDVINSYLSEYFNTLTVGIFKDIALLCKRRILDIKRNPSSLPEDCFSTLCEVYEKFIDQNTLKKEYIQFCQVYTSFEETLNLPQKLHTKIESFEESEDYIENLIESEPDVQELSSDPLNAGSMKLIWKIFQLGKLDTVFPTLNTTLRIALTLPISSATTERSFSKLKIIKNRLRTTMTESRLESLMIISCEQDIEVIPDEVLEQFAAKSTTLAKHLI